MTRTLLATGYLTWCGVERRSDRYGSVNFDDENENNIFLDPKFDELEGRKGRLVAEVIEAVESTHMGDMFRGLRPKTPKVGDAITLGEGSLFIEHFGQAPHEKSKHERDDDIAMNTMEEAFRQAGMKVTPAVQEEEIYDIVGLKPDDGRDNDWLIPEALYNVHASKVNLYFEED